MVRQSQPDKLKPGARRLPGALALSLLLHAALLATWARDNEPWCCVVRTAATELAVQLLDTPLRPAPPLRVAPHSAPAAPGLSAPAATEGPMPTATEKSTPPNEATLAAAAAHSRLAQQRLAAQLAHYFTYPALARRQGWEGQVLLTLTVEPGGHLQNLRVASSSGYAVLDAAALHALRRVGRLAETDGWSASRALDLRLPVIYRLTEH
jgi:protein TonB